MELTNGLPGILGGRFLVLFRKKRIPKMMTQEMMVGQKRCCQDQDIGTSISVLRIDQLTSSWKSWSKISFPEGS